MTDTQRTALGTGDLVGEPTGQDKLKLAHERLTAAVADLADSDGWQRMLTVAAKFHHYSPSNILLILAQRSDASAVTGFRSWQQLGRQVRRGEHGIAIFAPVRGRRKAAGAEGGENDTAPPTDVTGGGSPPTSGQLRPDPGSTTPTTTAAEPSDGTRSAESSTGPRSVPGFRIVHVFDISQTEGDDLPQAAAPELLTGQAPEGLWDGLAAQVREQGFSVIRADCGRANGITDYFARTVVVAKQLSDSQAAKTLCHELGHVLLHRPQIRPDGLDRPRAEVEAESVAYIVTAAHGLGSEPYTVAYVTGWASGDLGLLRSTADRVLSTAAVILKATPPARPPTVLTGEGVQRPFTPVRAQRRGLDAPLSRLTSEPNPCRQPVTGSARVMGETPAGHGMSW